MTTDGMTNDEGMPYAQMTKRLPPAPSSFVIFLFVAFFLGTASGSHAANQVFITTEPESGVKITLSSCFKYFPPVGYAPVSVKIENHSGGSGVWDFDFQSPAYSYGVNSSTFSAALAVENNSARTYDLLVPLAVLDQTSGYSTPTASVSVRGPGSRGERAVFASPSHSGKPHTVFIGLSSTVAARSWGSLEKQLDSDNFQLAGTEMETAELPGDWRALSGLTAFWITAEEWAKFSTTQKLAVKDWIAQGGTLFLCAQNPTNNPLATEFGESASAASAQEEKPEASVATPRVPVRGYRSRRRTVRR